MYAILNIRPKTYYKYRNKEDPDYYDYLIIKEIFDDSKGIYGYRRIVEEITNYHKLDLYTNKDSYDIAYNTPIEEEINNYLYKKNYEKDDRDFDIKKTSYSSNDKTKITF